MHKVSDYIIYKKEVCIINEIIPKYYKNMDYYVLSPISDDTLKIKVPTNNKEIRNLTKNSEEFLHFYKVSGGSRSHKSYEDTKEYVISKVTNLTK